MQPVGVSGKENCVIGSALQSNSLRIGSRHEGRSRRSADGRCHVKGSQLSSFRSHAVEMRSLVKFGTEWTNIAVAHVIDKNDDEVGWIGCG